MIVKSMITAARLREVLNYNPETGGFCWIGRTHRRAKVGCPTATRTIITVDYRSYKAHKLAWLWMTGEYPDRIIDHINQDPNDNRWSNLRLADRFLNGRNHKVFKNNRSGTTGLSWHEASKSWRVCFCRKEYGYFKDKKEAEIIAKQIFERLRMGLCLTKDK